MRTIFTSESGDAAQRSEGINACCRSHKLFSVSAAAGARLLAGWSELQSAPPHTGAAPARMPGSGGDRLDAPGWSERAVTALRDHCPSQASVVDRFSSGFGVFQKSNARRSWPALKKSGGGTESTTAKKSGPPKRAAWGRTEVVS
jgi:hypothetical protein